MLGFVSGLHQTVENMTSVAQEGMHQLRATAVLDADQITTSLSNSRSLFEATANHVLSEFQRSITQIQDQIMGFAANLSGIVETSGVSSLSALANGHELLVEDLHAFITAIDAAKGVTAGYGELTRMDMEPRIEELQVALNVAIRNGDRFSQTLQKSLQAIVATVSGNMGSFAEGAEQSELSCIQDKVGVVVKGIHTSLHGLFSGVAKYGTHNVQAFQAFG